MTETVQRKDMKPKEFEMKTPTSQKIGAAIFAIGAVYMFGLGWLIVVGGAGSQSGW